MLLMATYVVFRLNPLNAELNPICHLLALLGGATIVVVSRLRVNLHLFYLLVCLNIMGIKVKVVFGAFSTLRSFGLLYSCSQQVSAFISRGATHHTDTRDLYQRRRELLPNFDSKFEFTEIC